MINENIKMMQNVIPCGCYSYDPIVFCMKMTSLIDLPVKSKQSKPAFSHVFFIIEMGFLIFVISSPEPKAHR